MKLTPTHLDGQAVLKWKFQDSKPRLLNEEAQLLEALLAISKLEAPWR